MRRGLRGVVGDELAVFTKLPSIPRSEMNELTSVVGGVDKD